jgi:hypothetical protein
MVSWLNLWLLFPSDVSALSGAGLQEKGVHEHDARRAFDKAVRRKPPVVAAAAGLMQIQLREGAVWRCAGAVRIFARFGWENRLSEQNATEREKRRDWLAERIGFELTVEFHEKFRVRWRQNVHISSKP